MYRSLALVLWYSLTLQCLSAQLDLSTVNGAPNNLLLTMDSTIKAGDYERITSVLVAKDGQLLFEKYYNGTDQNTLRNTRSVTKTMATLLTGIAIREGHIQSEQDKIFTYLPHKTPVKNPDPRKEDITLEDLLTMSSIMECDDDNVYSRGNEERMYLIEDWTGFFLGLPIRSYPFSPQPADRPYGRAFSYCTAGASTMAEIIQSAIGAKLDQFAKRHLFEPLGINNYQLHYTPEGVLNTAGGSEYRSRDLLKLIQMCLNKGKWEGQEIVPMEWLVKATTPKVNVGEGVDYGYLFWLKSFGLEQKHPAYYMSGNGGQKVLAIPALKLTVVITTTNYGNRKAHNYTDELMNKFIVPAVVNK
ncbi:MAG: serine hydrolase [Bacteroidota bacterium]